MVLLDPLPDTGEVVLIEESHAVRLQRMAEIDGSNRKEFSIGVTQDSALSEQYKKDLALLKELEEKLPRL